MSEFVVTKEGGIAFIDFAQKEILDMASAKSIGTKLRELVDRKEMFNFVVDMRNIKLITSTMIGELLQLQKRCSDTNCILNFCNLSPDLLGLLKKLKLDKSFHIYPSRLEAVKAVMAEEKKANR